MELEDLLAIDVIVSEIFTVNKFRPRDLAQCSLVNKRWNGISRKILKSKVDCTLTLELHPRRSAAALDKIRWLQSSDKFNFYNTLKLKITQSSNHKCRHDYRQFLDALNDPNTNDLDDVDDGDGTINNNKSLFPFADFNTLEIEDDYPEHSANCQAFKVIRRICQLLPPETVKDLTVLTNSFDSIFQTNNSDDEPGKGAKGYLLNEAEFIKIQGAPQAPPDYENLLKNYPKLKKIFAGITISSLSSFVQANKSFLVSVLYLKLTEDSEITILHEFAKQNPSLSALIMFAAPTLLEQPFVEEIYNLILQSSKESLVSIATTIPLLQFLTQFISSLNRLTKLDLNYHVSCFESESFFQAFSGNKFPNLDTVEFTIVGTLAALWTENNNEELPIMFESVCPSVKNLVFYRFDPEEEEYGYSLNPHLVLKVSKVFPNLKKFSYKGTVFPISQFEFRQTCSALWMAGLQGLEVIEIAMEYSFDVSLESVILGISNEEKVHWLGLMREGVDLKDMQFAPKWRSCRDCPNLHQILVLKGGCWKGYERSSLIRTIKVAGNEDWVRLKSILGT